MLLFDNVRGLEYIIQLDKEYDYFDIIPDLEKYFRKRFTLRYIKRLNICLLIVINIDETHERFINSDYHINKENAIKMYYEKANNHELQSQLTEEEKQKEKDDFYRLMQTPLPDILPINLTNDELVLIENVNNYLGSKVMKSFWREGNHL